jgi:hypothetical protein
MLPQQATLPTINFVSFMHSGLAKPALSQLPYTSRLNICQCDGSCINSACCLPLSLLQVLRAAAAAAAAVLM